MPESNVEAAIGIVHLSQLVLDPRSRLALRALADPYAMHQHIYSGLPDEDQGGPGRVLYRVETPKDRPPFVLVQTVKEPNWFILQQRAITLTIATKQWNLDSITFERDQLFNFRLRANPTKREKPKEGQKSGNRIGLIREDDQRAWLLRQGENNGHRFGGFIPLDFRVVPVRIQEGRKPDDHVSQPNNRFAHYGVDFDGVLRVTDPEAFRSTVADGIGAAKGFGFGLLSIARIA